MDLKSCNRPKINVRQMSRGDSFGCISFKICATMVQKRSLERTLLIFFYPYFAYATLNCPGMAQKGSKIRCEYKNENLIFLCLSSEKVSVITKILQEMLQFSWNCSLRIVVYLLASSNDECRKSKF